MRSRRVISEDPPESPEDWPSPAPWSPLPSSDLAVAAWRWRASLRAAPPEGGAGLTGGGAGGITVGTIEIGVIGASSVSGRAPALPGGAGGAAGGGGAGVGVPAGSDGMFGSAGGDGRFSVGRLTVGMFAGGVGGGVGAGGEFSTTGGCGTGRAGTGRGGVCTTEVFASGTGRGLKLLAGSNAIGQLAALSPTDRIATV